MQSILGVQSTTQSFKMVSYSATPEQNAAALDYFIQLPVSKEMIAYLARKASEVIRCESAAQQGNVNKNLPPTPPATPPQSHAQTFGREPSLPSIEAFVTSLVDKSHVGVATLMSSLVYLARLKSRLPPVAKGMRCTVHRIFLASLILAAKNLNDSSPKNKHWARYSSVRGYEHFGFSLTEVNLMEKQLLFLLDWDLRINQDDLYFHLEPFLAPIRDYQVRQAERAQQLKRIKQIRELQTFYHENGHHVTLEYCAHQLKNGNITPPTEHSNPYSRYRLDASRPSTSSTSRSSSRMPSLSPPQRSGSAASSHSDLSSSTESTPSSIYHSEMPSVQRYDSATGAAVVLMPQAPPKAYKAMYHTNLPLPMEQQLADGEKPAKKPKTSGGFFARFLGTAAAR